VLVAVPALVTVPRGELERSLSAALAEDRVRDAAAPRGRACSKGATTLTVQVSSGAGSLSTPKLSGNCDMAYRNPSAKADAASAMSLPRGTEYSREMSAISCFVSSEMKFMMLPIRWSQTR
jgi:hypothetical protein